MASRNIKNLTAWSLLATALSGLAWWFGSGLTPNAWLTWLAPLPILLLAPQIGWRWAALAAAAAGACAGLNQWHYLHDMRYFLPFPPQLPVQVYRRTSQRIRARRVVGRYVYMPHKGIKFFFWTKFGLINLPSRI